MTEIPTSEPENQPNEGPAPPAVTDPPAVALVVGSNSGHARRMAGSLGPEYPVRPTTTICHQTDALDAVDGLDPGAVVVLFQPGDDRSVYWRDLRNLLKEAGIKPVEF